MLYEDILLQASGRKERKNAGDALFMRRRCADPAKPASALRTTQCGRRCEFYLSITARDHPRYLLASRVGM